MIKGDHLVSSRLGYQHHGLYIGNGKVIHYSGFSELFDKGSIQITTLDDFGQGHSVSVINHPISIYDANERVERAYSKLGEDSYNLIFNNCEHFVNWCFNGFKTSSQVNNVASAFHAAVVAANECAKIKGTETASSIVAQQVTRSTAHKIAETAITSAVTKSAVSTTASTAAGVTAASALTGTTAAGVASAVAAGSVASIAAPIAVAVGVGYGVKKVIDWFWD
ncbi:lecithin retinol acyltransferase family protein [Plesiomonas shigelloides]|uniref:lecithin retinol acyltransferase family protein n=1 Tax=Plesiomonas shigelloides TaxID=703 RepID=UPI001261404B|nr:lecithin retinol acyltransferase family protein [Plesiomonas shigelloides]KAB7653422.1 hypothetical protein GBN14_14940 [Plesiomonas shigelloides]